MTRFHQILTSSLIAFTAVALGACSMMEEDRSDCPEGLYVRFVYDYNTQRADMFKDHVGYVTVYVYDENGQKVAEKSVANSASAKPLARYGYTMHFSPSELPSGHSYRLQAVAMQKDWAEALSTPGAKYRRTAVASSGDLVITLDHEGSPIPGASSVGPHAVVNVAPLDTLWHTLKVMPEEPGYGYGVPAMRGTVKPYSVYPVEDQRVRVLPEHATYATVSLIRDTKHLNLTLRQLDDPESISADDYEVTILDDNAVLSADNSLAASDSLIYYPYAQWTTRYDEHGMAIEGDIHPATRAGIAVERTAHYNLMFNRLVYDEDELRCARLVIRNVVSGETVASINLASWLAEARRAYDWCNYSEQEFLDREYDYELHFFLRGDKWEYCNIQLHLLPWVHRMQNTELDSHGR